MVPESGPQPDGPRRPVSYNPTICLARSVWCTCVGTHSRFAGTKNTITDWTGLEAELAEIRSSGIAYDREESFEGIQIFTANRLKEIDSTSLRRFNHKVEFGYTFN